MCFHSPYVEFWHLYTFFKLLSISKEIDFCLSVLCKIKCMCLDAPESYKGRCFSWVKVTKSSGKWEMKTCCPKCPRWTPRPTQTEEEEWLLLRETNHFLGQQAVILDFLPYACFLKRERERNRTSWSFDITCPGERMDARVWHRAVPV